MDSLYIVIPAYNEAENIGRVIEEWYQALTDCSDNEDSRLVIIDDGSKDDTLDIARGYKERFDRLDVITRQNSGHGASIYYGYRYALDKGADFIFQTDSDGQTLASEFETFWNNRNGSDVIIGNRNNRQDGSARRFVSRVLRMIVGLIFGVKVTDVNTPYRLMDNKALKDAMGYIPEEYQLTNVALTAVFASMAKGRLGEDKKIKLEFRPITFKPRQGGKNSINLVKISKIGLKALSDLMAIRKRLS